MASSMRARRVDWNVASERREIGVLWLSSAEVSPVSWIYEEELLPNWSDFYYAGGESVYRYSSNYGFHVTFG